MIFNQNEIPVIFAQYFAPPHEIPANYTLSRSVFFDAPEDIGRVLTRPRMGPHPENAT
jgi:hypothetical protein